MGVRKKKISAEKERSPYICIFAKLQMFLLPRKMRLVADMIRGM